MIGAWIVDQAVSQINCPNREDYSPCTCEFTDESQEYSITCSDVPLVDIVGVFNRTTPADLNSFDLYMSQESSQDIPANLLNNHRVNSVIDLHCQSKNRNNLLRVDPDAFRSSKNVTKSFALNFCDISQLEFNFLNGFDTLSTLNLFTVANIHLADWAQSFPTLPSLNNLVIYNSTGMNDWTTFPRLSLGLVNLFLSANQLSDDSMDRILNWTLEYSSSNTLMSLFVRKNNLTRIPAQIPNFKSLMYLDMADQVSGIPSILSGSLNLASLLVLTLDLDGNNISKVEPDAFNGNLVVE